MSDLLPPNASLLERRVDETLGNRFSMVPGMGETGIRVVWNPDQVPMHMLPFLAHAFSVDLWDDDWSEEAKRNVTEKSLAVHRRKGTQGAIKDALRAAGYGEVDIIDGLDVRTRDGAKRRNGRYFYSTYANWARYRVIIHRPVAIRQAAQVRRIIERCAREACELYAVHYDEALHLHNKVILRDGTYSRGVIDGQLA